MIYIDRFSENTHIKFHENPPSGSRAVPCKQTKRHTDRQTDMTKLIDTILNFAKAREKREIVPSYKHFESFNETNSI
jgi:hypothetical protein